MYQYQVIVFSQGKIFESNDQTEAYRKYREHVRLAQELKDGGPSGKESVTLMDFGNVLAQTII